MSLYPIIDLTASAAAAGPIIVPSGNMICIAIDMTAIDMASVTLQQVSMTQDFSLRAWVSQFKGGSPLGPNYPVSKYGGAPIAIHTPEATPDEGTVAVLVQNGTYFLNVLNLTNETNIFEFTETDI